MKPTTLNESFETFHALCDHPPQNPLKLLQEWLEEAEILKIVEPRGMVLSTVDTDKKPSSRVVLLKTIDEKGVIFVSSETSKKGKDLQLNPMAAGTLWWRETMQQINFYGCVTKLPSDIADRLFDERRRESQAVAAVSHQSSPLINEHDLRQQVIELVNAPGNIKRPECWQAYHIAIEEIEFFYGSQIRFHNRLRYGLIKGVWAHQRLQP